MSAFRIDPNIAALLISVLMLSPAPSGAHSTAVPHTPAAGSAERTAIMDALRKPDDDPPRVFVVHSLKIIRNWAWVWVTPQSKDGQQHYEDQRALLQRTAGKWRLIDQECGEEACTEAGEQARIRKAHATAPAALFDAKGSQ